MSIVNVAQAVVKAVAVAMASMGTSAAEAKGATSADVSTELAWLRQAVATAIDRDRAEAANFWTKFLQGLENPFDYGSHRRQFEADGEALIATAEARLGRVERLVDRIVARADAPGRLRATQGQWLGRVPVVKATGATIDRLDALPGWTGPSATGYHQASVVQANATAELAGVATAMAQAVEALVSLNEASFRLAADAVKQAREQVPRDALSGGYYYTRASRMVGILSALSSSLHAIDTAQPIQGAVDALNSGVRSTMQAPALLEQGGWPTGGSQAGVPPTDPNNVPPADSPGVSAPSEVPLPETDETGGVRR